ncbi:MAG TPA: hypothetical protein VGC79_35115, partial [Polyangiaceae bacterium]
MPRFLLGRRTGRGQIDSAFEIFFSSEAGLGSTGSCLGMEAGLGMPARLDGTLFVAETQLLY